jgi:V/A-type H+-transporting ATPase subunit I
MIFGDAGYGGILTILAVCLCIGTRKNPKVQHNFMFMLLLAISNLIWGVLNCTWFGIDPWKLPKVLQDISLPLLANNFDPVNQAAQYAAQAKLAQQNIMCFCFGLGLAQLSIAHLIALINKLKAKNLNFIADLGILMELYGMFDVIMCLVVFGRGFGGVAEDKWPIYLLACGFLLNFIFGYYEGSIGQSILSSCKNIISVVLGITNVFSDTMSYIRLWAVGLAGLSIAQTVNTMAMAIAGSGANIVVHGIMFVLGLALIAFGHSFNLALNCLSVLVHGVRLNTLEFSTNLGLGWTGFAYKPFKRSEA